MHQRNGVALLLGCVLLAGCKSPLPTGELHFGLERLVPGTVVPTTRAAATGEGLGAGTLAVHFDKVLAKARRLLYTTADVASIQIRLEVDPSTWADLAHLPAPVSVTIAKGEIQAGVVSHTFSGLAFCTYVVEVTAFNAAGTTIGTASSRAEVIDAAPTAVSIPIRMYPTILPAPAGTDPTSGSLATTVTLHDGETLQALAKLGTYDLGDNVGVIGIAVSPLGSVVVSSQGLSDTLQWFEQDGRLAATSPSLGGDLPVFDQAGGCYLSNEHGLSGFSPSGAPLGTLGTFASGVRQDGIAVDPSGNLWRASGETLTKLTWEGHPIWTKAVPGGTHSVATLSTGEAWVVGYAGFQKYDTDGTLLATISFPATGACYDITADGSDHVRAALTFGEDHWLYNVSPDGAATRVQLPWNSGCFALDPAGNAWVQSIPDPANEGYLLELDPQGRELGRFYAGVGTNTIVFAIDPHRRLWIADATQHLSKFLLP